MRDHRGIMSMCANQEVEARASIVVPRKEWPGRGKRALMSNCHCRYYRICDCLDDTRLSGHVEEKTRPGCGWSHPRCWNPKPNKEK